MRIVGIVLLVVGLAGLAFGGFEYTRRKTVLDVGQIKVDRNEKQEVTIPPLFAGAAVAVGLVLVLTSGSKKG